jgi:hypothetical protein
MKAIPRRFLIHAASVRTPLKHNTFGEAASAAPVALRFVRIDCTADSPPDGDKPCGQLIYDCRNSRPSGFRLAVGQEVSFGGLVFTVRSVTPLYGGEKLHHVEAELVRGRNPRLTLCGLHPEPQT